MFAGSPAIGFNQMNIGQITVQATHRKSAAKDGYISAQTMAGAVHEAILSRCDEALDGVADGVMVHAEACEPKFEEDLLCGAPTKWGASDDTCLNSTQIANVSAGPRRRRSSAHARTARKALQPHSAGWVSKADSTARCLC